ncbi:MAG: hypothetical protein A3F40_00040 [Chlamydiae bacterium RIFCSPHIGHO2_12_FULL_27_8]|nr:MAG: hypothetical protein A3F40_00040 [Chlamydiae bacterium RIFCSPHIGHO2_12_FULL_27_8]OGN66900.1 MAG: hypothetical protein A2888_01915 [Chlamydiae bacterium RIFCSPLOWO2_01_FULL_28_7]
MKILIPTEGEDINCSISENFSKSDHFLLIDLKNDTWQVLKYKENNIEKFKNILENAIAQHVSAIIVKNIKPKLFLFVKELGLKIYQCEKCTAKEAEDQFKKNKLPILIDPH